MTWPKQQDPRPNRMAKAPYNFVPLPDKVLLAGELPAQNTYHTDRHTGWMDCVLTTSSPLYVRCGVLPSQFDQVEAKDLPDFFHTNPDALEPVIPGSSLRGMLRTLVEIVSYSKVQPVTDEPKVTFRAVAASRQDPLASPYQDALGKYGRNVKAGYLEQRGDQWFVRPARQPADLGLPGRDSYLKVKERSIQDNDIPGLIKFNQPRYRPQYHDVSFDAEARQDRSGRSYIHVVRIGPRDAGYSHQGVLVCSGNMLETASAGIQSPRRNHALVLDADGKAEATPINKQAVKDYLDSLTDFLKELPFDERRGCLVDGRPIFYVEDDGQVIMFGHCPNFRVPARLAGQERAATPLDFVPEALRDSSETDLAEAMFGYVEPDEKAGRPVACAGRVFISDATLEPGQDAIWFADEPITPKILASPKPTTFQHYLVQTRPNDRGRLHHYASPTPGDTVIRGHKLYWHKGDVSQDQIAETEKVAPNDTQHTEIKPVRSGVSFSFRIHFENLTDMELGALLWLLEMAAHDNYRLKLGMGKPLGLGAVKVGGKLHLTDRPARYAHLFRGDGWATGEKSDVDEAWSSATQAFEQWVLSARELNPRGVTALKDVERIKMLRFLLSWPGPSTGETRYLQIEHPQHGNEYKERPVLPTPAGVLSDRPQVTPVQREERPKPSTPPLKDRPRSPKDLRPGQVLKGTIRAIADFGAFVDVGVGHDGLVHISELSEERVAHVEDMVGVGQQVQVKVRSVERQKRKWRISLTMKGVEQTKS